MANTKIRAEQISGGLDGWIPANETWTYASATTFTISGDKTGKYQIGDKIKLTQTTTKYFYIIGVSYSSPNTTVTVTAGDDYSLANAAITNPYYSKAETPQGFPSSFNYTPTVSASSGTITSASASAKFSIHNGCVTVTGVAGVTDKGTGTGGLQVTIPVANGGAYACGVARENAVAGYSCHYYINVYTGFGFFYTYSGGSCVVNGYSLRYSVSYHI